MCRAVVAWVSRNRPYEWLPLNALGLLFGILRAPSLYLEALGRLSSASEGLCPKAKEGCYGLGPEPSPEEPFGNHLQIFPRGILRASHGTL